MRFLPAIQFQSPLGPLVQWTGGVPVLNAAWVVLAGVPVGIIILYFLKLRRRPVQVPSTLLWRRSLEDLHVNSLFQRLRRNLLLFLQLLAVLLAMLALANPQLPGTSAQGQRFVLVVDNSASMSATDVSPSRLERARREATKIVDAMEGDDLAMVIAFAAGARVVSPYTSNRTELRRLIAAIPPTQEATSLREALQVAAGLANPSRTGDVPQGVVASELVAPRLKIFSDGGFPDVSGFSLGNLQPELIVIGPPPPAESAGEAGQTARKTEPPSDNVAILALRTGRNEQRPDQFQVFGRIHNYRAEPVTTEARLLVLDPARPGAEGRLIDAVSLTIEPQADRGLQFDLPDSASGATELELRIDAADSLALDNRAFTLFDQPRRAQVLVVTPGNRYLLDALKTTTADLTVLGPEEAKGADSTRQVAAGRYDLVIYDRVRPESPPAANALYFGVLPPGPEFEETKPLDGPVILDWDVAHPLLQYVRDLGQVRILHALGVELPPGADTLIDSNLGPLAFTVPRHGYTDAVVTFGQYDADGKLNTDWHVRYSFPLFIFNSLRLLGNARDSTGAEVHRPGQPVILRSETPGETLQVLPPPGSRSRPATLKRTSQGTFVFNGADVAGLYHIRQSQDQNQNQGRAFAVNLFDPRESDLSTRGLSAPGTAAPGAIQIGNTPVSGTPRAVPERKDWWRPIAVAVLGLVLIEWYIYNRRVYI